MLAGLTLATAAAAALALGTQVAGTGECPPPAEVERRLPPLSSAVRVRLEPARGGVRVRVLDLSGQVLEDAVVSGETCEALAELAARHVEAWAASRGALRAEGALPPPPLVEIPELPGAPPEEGRAEASAGPPGLDLPFRLGAGVGAGALVDRQGAVAGFDAWGLIGPTGAPFWAEVTFSFTPTRPLNVGPFNFTWRRGVAVSVGGAYRFARAPIQALAGLQGAQLQARPLADPFDPVREIDFLDAGAYAGLRAILPLGMVNGWLGARLSAWFFDHRIVIGDPEDGRAASVPLLGVWFGLGVMGGDGP